MQGDIDDWDTWLRRALLVSIAMLLYAAPASAIVLDRFLGDEFMDDTSGFAFDEWLPFIIVIWLAAIPLIQAYRLWDDNPTASAAWLGAFLGLALLPTLVGYVFVYRAAALLVVLPALVFPFQWLDVDVPSAVADVAAIFAQAVTYTLFFAVPLGGVIVQLLQLRGSPSFR